jgi:hypothetical protein
LRSPPSSNCDTAFQLRLPESVQEARVFEDVQPEESAQDYKASLSVRLRVIFGGAILLWALIIWAAWSLYKFI